MENLEGGTLSLEHRYRVESRRDRHALTTRYAGLQLPFERPVWIKVYDPLAEAGAETRIFERIKRSAHRAHRIDGASVLQSLDYGELDKGVPFVISERASGPTLADYLEEHGPLPPGDAIEMGEALADALEAAHEVDLAHGTVDPEWIYLQDGRPADARLDHFHVGLTLDELRSVDGAVLTPDLVRPYPPETFERDTIPPEEAPDDHDPTEAFTPAADIYGLGCVLYEALVGFHPYFDDDSSTDASDGIVQLQSGEPRPLDEFGVAPELSDLVARAVGRDPADRFDSAREFVDRLREAQSDEPLSSAESGRVTAPADERPAAASTGEELDVREPAVEDEDSTDASEELEPGGPSSVLVTLTVGLLFASNIGWFFFYMRDRADTERPEPKVKAAGAVETFRVDSSPEGAAVYAPGREEPIGRTPVEIPGELAESGAFELQLKKTGFSDTTVSVRRDSSRQTITVDLSKGATR